MMKLSIVTNSISSVAQSAAIHIKNLCINSKVDALFRVTVKTAGDYPYVAVGLGLIAIYCSRGQIEGLITKVNEATQFLYGKIKNSITSAASIFRRNSTPPPLDSSKDRKDLRPENLLSSRDSTSRLASDGLASGEV